MFLLAKPAMTTMLMGIVLGPIDPVWADPPLGGGRAELPSRASVRVARVPDGGIQPQVAVDEHGTVHLIYFKGKPEAGDVFYCTSRDDARTYSAPIRVNSQNGSVIAMGSVRGAHLALGRRGRVHVAWMGADRAEPAAPGERRPMLYARLNDAGTAFEPQRNVIRRRTGLDGGGSVAADAQGHVYVVWHAPGEGADDETGRRVWVARSDDDGATFAEETAAFDESTGACGCCGMRAFATRAGDVFILYRSAQERVHRDMYLLHAAARDASFKGIRLDPWESQQCMMSTAAFAEAPSGVVTAWETKGQIRHTRMSAGSFKPNECTSAPGATGRRKHPALAVNSRGEVLLAWTEGVQWNSGGSVAWQTFDAEDHPKEHGSARDLPPWDFVAAFATRDDGFVVLY